MKEWCIHEFARVADPKLAGNQGRSILTACDHSRARRPVHKSRLLEDEARERRRETPWKSPRASTAPWPRASVRHGPGRVHASTRGDPPSRACNRTSGAASRIGASNAEE